MTSKKYIMKYKNSTIIKRIRYILKLNFRFILQRENRLTNKKTKPFFIVGSGRSGTTLLRAILMKNKDIAIPPESFMIPAIIRRYKKEQFLYWNELAQGMVSEFISHPEFLKWDFFPIKTFQKIKKVPKKNQSLETILDLIYMEYLEVKFPNAKIWGDKTPMNTFYINEINELFPNAKYVHTIRDGRAVVSSCLKTGLYSDIHLACLRWKDNINIMKDFKEKNPKKVIEVKYEDLVLNPAHEIKRICTFLGIKFHKNMVNHHINQPDFGDVRRMKHLENVTKKISKDPITKWKRELSTEQIKLITKKLNEELKDLNYIEKLISPEVENNMLFNLKKKVRFMLSKVLFKFRLVKKRLFDKKIKIIVGAANTNYDGWLSTNKAFLDITKYTNWKFIFRTNQISNILTEHVFEHLNLNEVKKALKNSYIFLKKGGRIRIAVPDGYFPDKEYIEYVKPNGVGPGADDHKILFNYKSLSELIKEAGFKVSLLEYFDEKGKFHKILFSNEDGYIMRSFDNDKRNKNGIKYTSLIIDGVKE